jgi:hypothetical protein
MHKELLTRQGIHLPGPTFNSTSSRVVLSMVVARGVVLKLGAVMMTVYGWEENLVYPCLEVIIEQATALLTFSVETWEEEVE